MISSFVTMRYRPSGATLGPAASGQVWRLLPVVIATGTLLAGCTSDGRPSDQEVARRGYWYHDGNHPDGTGQASAQAIYNAAHGVWLWPPAEYSSPPR